MISLDLLPILLRDRPVVNMHRSKGKGIIITLISELFRGSEVDTDSKQKVVD